MFEDWQIALEVEARAAETRDNYSPATEYVNYVDRSHINLVEVIKNMQLDDEEPHENGELDHECLHHVTKLTKMLLALLNSFRVELCPSVFSLPRKNPSDVDLLLLCTSNPDDLFGSARQIQATLGCKGNPLAFDITASCSGFVLGLVSASCYIRGGGFKNVLVIGADALSRYVYWTYRGTCILFGDATGAVLVKAYESEEDGLFGFDLHSDGEGNRHLHAAIKENEDDGSYGTNGSAVEFPPKSSSYSFIQMNGK